MKSNSFAFVDVETTGFSAVRGDRIIEIGILRWSRGRYTRSFQSLVNPGRSIPPLITGLTSISSQAVMNKPRSRHLRQRVQRMLRNAHLVTHGAFDLQFLRAEFGAKTVNPERHINTVVLSRRLHRNAKSHKLAFVARRLGIRHANKHRAFHDAHVMARCFFKMVRKAQIARLDDLMTLLGKNRKR